MDYYKTESFTQHRTKIYNLLEQIPSTDTPEGWKKKASFSVGGFEYFGFSESSDILFVASSDGRSLFDIEKNERIARDYSTNFLLDEVLLVSEGFDLLDGEIIKLSGIYGGSILPTCNKKGESLLKVSPLYPCEDVIFQPPYTNCFIESHCNGCMRVYRGFLYCYGFSFSGNVFVIAGDGGITCWQAD